MDMKLEVVVVPVTDVDRTKQFYKALGWREDADLVTGEDFRMVQLTPPGSACSIHFGTGVPSTATPGSAQGMYLIVSDIEAASAELVEHGANVSEIFHDAAGGLSLRGEAERRESGRDPDRRSYASYATFTDPDGNSWVLQEITMRLPGRATNCSGVPDSQPSAEEAP